MKQDIIITVGCEYGAGGPAIGKKIAEDLGLAFYDRSLIDKIIEETGISRELTEMADAGVEIKGRSAELAGSGSPSRYAVLTDRVVMIQKRIIEKLAERGPCVFVGRCADYVLKDRENVLNVFVYAPDDYRLENIKTSLKLSDTAAQILMDKNDKQLHARYKQMTGTYRGDRHNRHILIDSSVLGIEGTAEYIELFAERKFAD